MLKNWVSAVRRCRGILFLVAVVTFVSQVPAQDRTSKMPSDQVSASTWAAIPPPPGDMIVGFYQDATVMVGLNHVYADSEKVTADLNVILTDLLENGLIVELG